MIAVPSENTLLVKINGNQSHEELLTYIQAQQKEAPIRQLDCQIDVHEEEFGVQHPIFSFIRSTPTLECVEFSNYHATERPSIGAFLDAISQNHSIHTVKLYKIVCSAYAIHKLMERKMKWKVHFCHFVGHPFTLNQSTSYVEELDIQYINVCVMDFMAGIRSWPFLRQLFTGIALQSAVMHLVERIIPMAPILQELTIHDIYFDDPDQLQSCATIVFNAPSPDLKWHLDDCEFGPKTMAVLEKIVKMEKAKLMRIRLKSRDYHYEVVRTIMSESSRVGNLDIYVQNSGPTLKILPLLRQEQPFSSTYYPCTSIHLTIDTHFVEQYRDIIDSIQHWTPRVKKLFLHFAPYYNPNRHDGNPSRPFVRRELIQGVRNNMHLQFVELDVKNVKSYNGESAKNEDEQCRALLERYCERNRKLHATLDEADSIPLHVWPYVFHLASRGGADMLYRHLRQNAGYTLNGWHNKPPPPSSPKM